MLSEAFKVLVFTMIQSFKPKDCDPLISIVDSMPIVTCKGKNRKVATEITSKGVLLHQEHVLLWHETAHGKTTQGGNDTFP